MFRCPTCIGVLADPTAQRCPSCGQRLRNRRPRVLGEEHRPGAKMLPIDRALHDRLHGVPAKGRRARHLAPPPWLEHYNASATNAVTVAMARESALVGGGGAATMVAPATYEAVPIEPFAAAMPAAPMVEEPPPLDITAYLARFEPVPAADDEIDLGEPTVAGAGATTLEPPAWSELSFEPAIVADEPSYAIESGPLDPEVQALVDDLYRKARAEIAGPYDAEGSMAAPAVDEPAATSDEGDASSASPQPRRRAWVPAVLSDRRRNDPRRSDDDGWQD